MAANRVEDMPLRDRMYMDPIEKYKVYDLFPWGLILHLILVFLTSTQVCLVVNSSSLYSYSQFTLWNELFLNKDVQGSDNSLVTTYHLFNIADLRSYINETVDKYYHINDHTIDNYKYELRNGKIKPISMYVVYVDRTEASHKGYRQLFDLSPSDLGPFQHYNLKEYLDIVDKFELEFTLQHHLNDHVPVSATCFDWTIRQRYNYGLHGAITVELDVDRGVCSANTCDFYLDDIFRKFMWLNLSVLICAFLSFSLTCHYLYTQTVLMSTFKHKRKSMAIAWDNLSLQEKFKFIDMWIIINTIGNIAQAFGSLSAFVEASNILVIHETVIGIGCFCAWVGILRFLEPAPTSYTVVNTLKRSYQRLGPYMIGVLPVFMAFAFLSMCLFWKTGNYPNPTDSMIVNFAMLNGDSLYPFFSAAVDSNYIFGQLYMYGFIVFFICCIQNIFIAIFQEGYNSLRVKPIPRGDETDEEDDEDLNIFGSSGAMSPGLGSPRMSKKQSQMSLVEEESKQKSRNAFKKILAGKLILPLLNDMTNVYMDRLEQTLDDIKDKLQVMVESSVPITGEIVNKVMLRDRLEDIIIELQDHCDKTVIP